MIMIETIVLSYTIRKPKKYSIQRNKKDVEGTESDSIIELKDKWFNREKDDEDDWF